jgi:hypothetical protein
MGITGLNTTPPVISGPRLRLRARADKSAVAYLGKLSKSTVVYYLGAFTVSVLFATLQFSTVNRPIVFNFCLLFLGLVFLCHIVDLIYLRNDFKGFLEQISKTILTKALPLALTIVVLDWIFHLRPPGEFAEYEINKVDEYYYVRMMLNGIFSVDKVPYSFRWLTPLLTGSLNILPVQGLSAFTVFNFACLVTTAIVLIQTLQELKVNKLFSLLVPIFLFDAFLGRYAAHDHYLTDPATYMFFAIYLWCLIDPKRYIHLSWLLVLGVLNSEKCVYWLPIVSLMLMNQHGFKKGILESLSIIGPAILVFFIPRIFLGNGLVANLTPLEHSPSNLHLLIDLPLSKAYFPFSFLTIFFVMGFNRLPVVLKVSSLILLPVYSQLSIAGFHGDDNRMIAYTFIIYIPASLYYIQKLFEPVPYNLGVFVMIPLLLIAHFDYRFTLPICFLVLLTGTEIVPRLKQHTFQSLLSLKKKFLPA